MEAARIGTWPPGHPADRTGAGDALDRLDTEADMLALDLFRDHLVVEPAIAVADDLMPVFDKGVSEFGVALGCFGDRQQTHLDPEPAEQAQQAPAADARAVFENRLDHRAAHPRQ